MRQTFGADQRVDACEQIITGGVGKGCAREANTLGDDALITSGSFRAWGAFLALYRQCEAAKKAIDEKRMAIIPIYKGL